MQESMESDVMVGNASGTRDGDDTAETITAITAATISGSGVMNHAFGTESANTGMLNAPQPVIYRDRAPFVPSSSPPRDPLHQQHAPRTISTRADSALALLGDAFVPSSSSAGAEGPDSAMTPPSSSPQSPLAGAGSSFSRHPSAAADPFSGSAKAPSMAHHPSFGKQFPHVKHPHPARVPSGTGTGSGSGAGANANAKGKQPAYMRGSSSPGRPVAGKKRGLDASPQQAPMSAFAGNGAGASTSASASEVLRGSGSGASAADVFGSFFHDGDGACTSSDDSIDFRSIQARAHAQRGGSRLNAAPSGDDDTAEEDAAGEGDREQEAAASGLRGLGLGSAFEEHAPQAAGSSRRPALHAVPASSDDEAESYPHASGAGPSSRALAPGPRQRVMVRERSHPYDAFGPVSPPPAGAPRSPQASASGAGGTLIGSPGSRAPAVRRARLAGSSPTQLTVARRGRFAAPPPAGSSDDEDEGMADVEDGRAHQAGTSPAGARLKHALQRPLRAWERLESEQYAAAADAGSLISSAVAKAFDSTKPTIDLSSRGLSRLSPAIADLGNYVAIPMMSAHDRGDEVKGGGAGGSTHGRFSRTSTADAVALARAGGPDSPATSSHTAAGRTLASPPRSVSQPLVSGMERSSSSSYGGGGGGFRGGSQRAIGADNPSAAKLFLGDNRLRILPSALFAVQNLTVLSLWKNALTHIPPAIAELSNLQELNIASNEIRYLPAEIQKLTLRTFNYHPNPFMRPPAGAKLTLRHIRSFEAARAADSQVETPSGAQKKPEGEAEARFPMGPPALPARLLAAREARDFGRTRSDQQVARILGSSMPDLASYAGTAARVSAAESAPVDAEPATGQKRKRVARASYLGDLQVVANGVPTLRDMCTRIMLELVDDDDDTPARPGQGAPAPKRRRQHLRLEELPNGVLHDMGKRGQLNERSLRQLESARRSATKSWNSRPDLSSQRPVSPSASHTLNGSLKPFPKRVFRSWCSGADVFNESHSGTLSSSDVIAELNEKGDDASENPWFNRCPNPEHSDSRGAAHHYGQLDWPLSSTHAPAFLNAAESRIEWVSHVADVKVCSAKLTYELDSDTPAVLLEASNAASSGCLPVVWRGCKRNCLHFLQTP